MEFVPIASLAKTGQYHTGPDSFFANFDDAWQSARGQILKLETLQSYVEDNASLNLAFKGDWEKAKEEIAKSRLHDDPIYKLVREKHLDFIRCRSIEFPKTTYVRWELEVYKQNVSLGEKIYCCNRYTISDVFDLYATHDFMVFDSRIAFIHDYDSDGQILGGWSLTDQNSIRSLIALHGFIKANSQWYEFFVDA